MPEIISREEASKRGLKRFFTGNACRRGHKSDRTVSCGACIECKNAGRRTGRTGKPYGPPRCEIWQRAIDEGSTRYFTGRPCKYGHLSERSVKNRGCIECDKLSYRNLPEEGRTHIKKKAADWHAKNPEKSRKASKKYREKPESRAKAKLREKLRAQDPDYRDRRRQQTNEWRAKNVGRMRLLRLKYHYEGPKNPTGEMQWLRKNRAQLQSVKRYLQNQRREQSESSQPET